MKKVTYEQFLKFEPCWLKTGEGRARLERIGHKQKEWSALDVFKLKRVPAEDRLWAVLRPEFLPDEVLHEFACRCAEAALSIVKNPDPRSIDAIKAKRAWMHGEIDDRELDAARDAAWDAAWDAVRNAAQPAAQAATQAAEQDAERAATRASAWGAAQPAAQAAARAAAQAAARAAARAAAQAAARAAAWKAACTEQIDMLIKLIQEDENK